MEIHWHSNQLTAETELDDRGQLRTNKQREKGREGCAAQSDEDETRAGA
jgi:hypothetical protein